MIEYLSIKDLGVIAGAELELSAGLVVVTGETGAGKTMIMTALDLLFGGRANPALIRSGATKTHVEAGIRIADPRGLGTRHDLDLELDDDILIVARSVSDQRSRASLGGRGISATVLARLGDDLVVRHGQNDQRRLASGRYRRFLLDRYAGAEHLALLADFHDLHDRLRAAIEESRAIRARARDAEQRADLLRHGVEEISAVGLQPQEDDAVRAELQRIEHIVDLRQAMAEAHEALRADEVGAESAIHVAGRALERAGRFDAELAEPAEALAQVQAIVADIAGSLAGRMSSLDADPGRLDVLQQRLAQINALRRKYGATVAEVLQWQERAVADLLTVDTAQDRLAEIDQRRDRLSAELVGAGLKLHGSRVLAAQRLGAEVTAELVTLAMPHAELRLAVELSADGDEKVDLPAGGSAALRRDGFDEVSFGFIPHSGAPPRPVEQAASGGEMSRVMLALEVALAGAHPVPVFVFDEVDAGIGGRAAVEVGRRLAALARGAQVIVVTHLPQVAAFADQDVVVRKRPDGQVTASSVAVLSPDERTRELARMMAGQDGSSSALAHAEELIDLAARERARA